MLDMNAFRAGDDHRVEVRRVEESGRIVKAAAAMPCGEALGLRRYDVADRGERDVAPLRHDPCMPRPDRPAADQADAQRHPHGV